MEYTHPETKHSMHEDDHADRKEMLEDAVAHAKEHGPEHQHTLLKSLHDEMCEYEGGAEEQDEEDEEEATENEDKRKDEGDPREKHDDKEHYNEKKAEGSEEKESDIDKIHSFVSSLRK